MGGLGVGGVGFTGSFPPAGLAPADRGVWPALSACLGCIQLRVGRVQTLIRTGRAIPSSPATTRLRPELLCPTSAPYRRIFHRRDRIRPSLGPSTEPGAADATRRPVRQRTCRLYRF